MEFAGESLLKAHALPFKKDCVTGSLFSEYTARDTSATSPTGSVNFIGSELEQPGVSHNNRRLATPSYTTVPPSYEKTDQPIEILSQKLM